ncbi:MAG TPA: GFA family protein [Steroidobacteraceae bacterium]
MSIQGGCLCRAVRYESTADPKMTRVCWCRVCQYVGAGNGTVNVFFPADTLNVRGETRSYRSVADSGNVMHRRFCLQCGTPLFTASEARPHLIGVRAGTLDDPNLVQPALTIWTASAPRWACIAPSIPRVERQPPPPA